MRQVTEREGVAVGRPATTTRGALLINYADPQDAVDALHRRLARPTSATQPSWRQLTDANPQVRSFALGEQEEITWKSKDGTMVGGVLVEAGRAIRPGSAIR